MKKISKEEFILAGGDARWFDLYRLTGEDICALVQAGSQMSMIGRVIFDHPDVKRVLDGKKVSE